MREAPISLRDMALATAERIAGIGYGLWDERARSYVFVSEQYANFYDLTPEEYLAQYQTFEDEAAWIHSDDRGRYESHYRNYLGNPRECSIEMRYHQPEHGTRYVREFMASIFDDSGQLIHTCGR